MTEHSMVENERKYTPSDTAFCPEVHPAYDRAMALLRYVYEEENFRGVINGQRLVEAAIRMIEADRKSFGIAGLIPISEALKE